MSGRPAESLMDAVFHSFGPVAHAMRHLGEPEEHEFVPGSPSDQDASEYRHLPDGTPNPIHVMARTVAARLLSASDHMNAIAGQSTRHPRLEPPLGFAAGTLARGVLEALAFTYHLVEPGVSAQERVRRAMAEVEHDVRQRVGATEASGLSFHVVQDDAERLAEQCDRYGIDYKRATKVRDGGKLTLTQVQGEKRPAAFAILTPLMPSESTPNLGAILYHLASNVAHASGHGLLANVNIDGVNFNVSPEDNLGTVAPVLWATDRPIAAVLDYFGWDHEPWQQAMMPAMIRLGEWKAQAD